MTFNINIIFSLFSSGPVFQGALYCLLGNHSGICLANLQYWDCIALTWPAIVRFGLSPSMSLEKSSIVRLFDDLADKIHRQYETISIDISVSSALLGASEYIFEDMHRF